MAWLAVGHRAQAAYGGPARQSQGSEADDCPTCLRQLPPQSACIFMVSLSGVMKQQGLEEVG